MCLETLKELMIGVQDWDQIKQHRDCESPSDGKGLACQGGWCSLKQLAYQVVTYVAHSLSEFSTFKLVRNNSFSLSLF